MKKTIVVLLFLILICGSVFASDNYLDCSRLITNKLDDAAIMQIQKYSGNLTDTEKYMLFENNKKDAGLPFALNLILGCGIGSFVQGDTVGGCIELGTELVSYLMLLNATGNAVLAETNAEYSRYASQAGLWTFVLLASRIGECIRPFEFKTNYNKKLNEAIYGGDSATVTMVPSIGKGGGTLVSVVARVPLN